MINHTFTLIVAALVLNCTAVVSLGQSHTPFSGNASLTYEEAIKTYEQLAADSDYASMLRYGQTDIGEPLHLFVIDSDGNSDPRRFDEDKSVLLINNGIHPGEPCGIDASVVLAREFLSGEEYYEELLEDVIICIVPVYNIGGSLNRGCCSRANQNGPREYGFRGNAKNLDLNRDFIKADSDNAKAFYELFHDTDPEVLVDTHTSNGADYQYTMTLITTQPDKAAPELRWYLRNGMNDSLYSAMERRNFPMTPYVHTIGKTPDSGIKDYLEIPRFSTGYAALFNTLGFVTETHMLKPFEDRVESTYQFLMTMIEYMAENSEQMIALREKANEDARFREVFPLQWKLDTTKYEMFDFKGYEAEWEVSEVTGKEGLTYNQSKPFEKAVRYYNRYKSVEEVRAPDFYIIPQAWDAVIDRLMMNGVDMRPLDKDTVLTVEVYYIRDFKTADNVYEGHYLHRKVEVEPVVTELQYRKGDFVIPVEQTCNRYIVETLEPQGVDSFFAWNFFDSILQQKEWFSDYVFEDTAEEMLEKSPELKEEFEAKKDEDAEFSKNHWGQLYWIYQHSDNYENTVNRYPVARHFGR